MTDTTQWSGRVGDAWAAEWARTDRSFADLSRHLDAAIRDAAPAGGAGNGGCAVDLGCGAGQTSITLATSRPDLDVTGVDVSPELVRVATDRGRDRANLRFVNADVARDARGIAAGADLLFSRHGIMFFADPAAVFADLRAGAASGARLVFSCFRAPALNPWAGTLAAALTGTPPVPATGYAPGPFGFADPALVAPILRGAGWRVDAPRAVDFTYVAGAGAQPVADAVAFFTRIGPVAAAIAAAPDAERPALRDRLAAALEPYRDHDRISFPAAAWIWSAHA